MLEDLYKALKKENLLEQAYTKTSESLQILDEMFDYAFRLLRKEGTREEKLDIYIQDRKVDECEREIRRMSLTHLALSDQEDLNATLVLIAIVHDIERIGDYSTNIFELFHKQRCHLSFKQYETLVSNLESTILKVFKTFNLNKFAKLTKNDCRKIMDDLSSVKNEIEKIIDLFIKNEGTEDFSNKEAVVAVLYLRYLKRIASHLNNIATSFVNPFERIGFRE